MAKKKVPSELLLPQERIAERIYFIRGQKVMLDEDLSELYDVPTKRLNQQVTRNMDRFPDDFMFRLTREEDRALRLQNVTLKARGQHRKYYPRAFTEHGILMLSSVLRSEQAVQVNIAIMRAVLGEPLRKFQHHGHPAGIINRAITEPILGTLVTAFAEMIPMREKQDRSASGLGSWKSADDIVRA